ncbi:MAG: hypothetical protein R3E97_13035 [Candidatus Eisenbacteria bacterium]
MRRSLIPTIAATSSVAASTAFLSLVCSMGCSDQPTPPTDPSTSSAWQLLGTRTTEIPVALAGYRSQIMAAFRTVPSGEELDSGSGGEAGLDSAVSVRGLTEGIWTPLGGTLSGTVRDMVEFQGSLWVGGDLYESAGTPLNGLVRWDGAEWRPEGPAHPSDPDLSLMVSGLLVREDGLVVATVSGWLDGDCRVAEITGGDYVSNRVDVRTSMLVDWNGSVVVGGSSAGDVLCSDSPRILRRIEDSWSPFDAGWYDTEPCYYVGSGTVWSETLVLTGGHLPGSDVASVHTWDGVTWGNLGSWIPATDVRAFGDRLLAWSDRAVFEWDGATWHDLGGPTPGSITDVLVQDGAVVICGRHDLGGGYVAVQSP